MDAPLDDGPKPGRAADAAENGERCAGGDAAGAGHDNHRDRRVDVACDQESEHGGSEREVDEVSGHAVSETLDWSSGLFSPLDCFDDLAVARVATDPLGGYFKRAGLVDGAGEDLRAGRLLDRYGFAGDARFVDEGMAREHGTVDGNPAAGRDQDGLAHRQLIRRDGPDRTGAADRDFTWQEFEKIADRFAATADGQAFQHLRDENEQGDDQRRKELADGRRRGDGDRHRQFHGHAALDNVLEGLLEDSPAANQKADDADDADRRKRLPDAEPHGRRRNRDKRDASGFRPFERMGVIMAEFVIMVMLMVAVGMIMVRRVGPNQARLSGLGMRVVLLKFLDGHDQNFHCYLR